MLRGLTILVVSAFLAAACSPGTPDPDQDCRFACETDQDCKSGFTCRHGRCASTPGEDCLEDFEPRDGGDDGGFPDGDEVQFADDGDGSQADDGVIEDGDEQPGDDAGIQDGDLDVADDGDGVDGGDCADVDACQSTITLPDGRRALGLAYSGGYLFVLSHLESQPGSCYVSKVLPSTGVEITGASQLAVDGRGITVGESVVVGDATSLHILNSLMSNVLQVVQGPGLDVHGIAYAQDCFWMADPENGWVYGIDQSGNPCTGIQPQGASMELVQGLEWDGQGFWMDTGETRLQRFSTTGLLEGTVEIVGLPPGSDIYDIALGDGQVFISLDTDTIYVQPWPQK